MIEERQRNERIFISITLLSNLKEWKDEFFKNIQKYKHLFQMLLKYTRSIQPKYKIMLINQ